MSLTSSLIAFTLRQALGDRVVNTAQAVLDLFRDHSKTLPQAIHRAHQRAWQSLTIALAGQGLLDRLRVVFASGDAPGRRARGHKVALTTCGGPAFPEQ